MFQSLDILRMAQTYATHAATRQQAISQNVANADTPGYRTRDAIPFADFGSRRGTGRRGQRPWCARTDRPRPWRPTATPSRSNSK